MKAHKHKWRQIRAGSDERYCAVCGKDEQAVKLSAARAEVRRLKAESKREQQHTNNYIRLLHKAEAVRDYTLDALRQAHRRLVTLGEAVPEFVYQELVSLLDDEMLDENGKRYETRLEAATEALEDAATHAKCDCGHPHCNRCRDYSYYVEAIAKAKGEA